MNSWQIKKLGEITENLDSKRVPIDAAERNKRIGNIPYYGANGQIDWIDDYLFDEPLLLVAEDGGNWGPYQDSSYMITGKSWVNNHAHVLRTKDMSMLKYLNYYLNYNDLRRYISGTTRGKLNQKALNSIDVLVPPEEVKDKIVEKLDAIRKLQELNQKEIDKATILFNNTIRSVFSSRLGKKCKINEVSTCFQYGLSRTMNSDGNGLPILRINSIKDGEITSEDLKHVEVTGQELEKYKVEFNDILFNRTNSYELVGKTGIFKLKGAYIFASYLIRLKANNEVLPDYLNYFLNSPIGQAEIRKRAKRAVSQANVNAKELGSITIHIPEKSIQKEKVEQLDTIKKYLQILNQKDQKLSELIESSLNKLLSRKNYE